MNEAQKAALLEFFQAVGQTERLKILGLLAGGTYSIPDLAELLGMKENDVSNQITKLQKVGLVSEDSRAFRYQYRLNSAALRQLEQLIEQGQLPESSVEQVLALYTDGQRLRRLPADPAERKVVLKWLSQDFEKGRRYSLEEVDQIIGHRYPRQLTLRRHLLSDGLLKHTGDVFWRPVEDAHVR